MIKGKFTFGDLNLFVDQAFSVLPDCQEVFYNQALALDEDLPNLQKFLEKVDYLHCYVYSLKVFQEITNLTLEFVEKNLNKWDHLLSKFEKEYHDDLMLAPDDPMRIHLSDRYEKFAEIFTFLRTSYELLENLDKLGQKCREKKLDENSEFALFRVVQNNLSILEKLFLNITKLKSTLDSNEIALSYMLQELKK